MKFRILVSIFAIILVITITLLGIYFISDKASSDNIILTPTQLTTSAPVSPPEELLIYNFKNYPIKFQYSTDIIIDDTFSDRNIIKGDLVKLSKNGASLTIKAKQPGLGFGDEDIELISSDFDWNNQTLEKTRLHYIPNNTDSFLITIPYPDNQDRDYRILITYEFKDGKIDEELNLLFDKIVKSLEITDITLR